MSSSTVPVDFGPHSPDSDYEHINYPLHSDAGATLPLYYSSMAEEKARRRVRGPAVHNAASGKEQPQDYSDEGKDVYSKPHRAQRPHFGGGRMPQQPPPPPTSIVRVRFLG